MLLAGPTVLAFFSGGYFDEARAWAGLGAWILVVIALIVTPHPLPSGLTAWLAIGALGLLAVWTLLSITWAPEAGSAYHAGQIVVLYVGMLVAAVVLLLGSAGAVRWVEPALAAGALIVVGYGMSERLLPGLLHFAHSVSAEGRLEQPLTYWNAMGEQAALGLILCTRLAGDVSRPDWLRAAGAAASAPAAMALYVSFSRGALFAWLAGLITLLVVMPRPEQLRAIVLCTLAGVAGVAASVPFHGVTGLSGGLGTRETQGAITLVILVVVMLIAGVAQRAEKRRLPAREITLPRRAPALAAGVVLVGVGLAIVVGSKESSTASQPLSGGATRLVTLQSNRYAYWNVALRAFTDEPLHGVGGGGWAVDWLRYRTVNEFAADAHSLELQTLAELGVVGLALLLAFMAGVGLAARAAHRVDATVAAGPLTGVVVYLAHSPLDWDWQMPAVTLIAVVLAGALLALAQSGRRLTRLDRAEAPQTLARP